MIEIDEGNLVSLAGRTQWIHARLKDEVVGLDIPMQHTLAVNMPDGLDDLLDDLADGACRHDPIAELR
eukprot:CAMPEP_0183466474 /NCGR_PEP_ID=MMETSP0370-20130417/149131_1 /TAXON_ID=268820 /ORGANISM="Peridinium aciculiferum, Strain PAER-2" /LENGTH=67 /DNA_ID=CAMNT_0025658753 /DNA_START=475 /DNA_END=678 /DNA_ORIENTATION=+